MASAAMAAHMNPTPWGACRNLIEKSLDQDSSLVDRCLSGDDAAWEELVRQHTRRVYGLCYRFTGRDSEINIENPGDGHDAEFVAWRWVEMEKLPDLVVPFKRKTYERVVKAFSKFTT